MKVEHVATDQTGTNATIDYRYTGKSPNNYVYFGCSESCTEDNLYRIIGVIPTQSEIGGTYENRVKLIKDENWLGNTAGNGAIYTPTKKGYSWNSKGKVNKWEESSLNEILNNEYLVSLGEYQKYIDPSVWYLGAPIYSNYTTDKAEDYYKQERSNRKSKSGGTTTYVSSIGLMYPSDYGYSLDEKETITNGSVYNNREKYKAKAWLFHHPLDNEIYVEWAMNAEAENGSICAWGTHSDGFISYHCSINEELYSIRPTFYLNSEVQYKSGKGTIEEPYHIFIQK